MKFDKLFKIINKKDFIELISITLVTLILCSNFLQMHFSSDTYALINLGYFKYPSKYFLIDGRILSALVCYIGGLLHLPYPVYIVGMDFLGMIFLSLSIYIFSKIICDILKPENLFLEILIILASHLLILNQFSLEYLLFPESAVMCLGVLFVIIALKILVQKPKYAYLKIWGYLLITALSYQGELNFFPLLAILIYVLKQIKENKKIGMFLKEFFIEMLKLALITITVLAISLIVIKIGKSILNNTETKLAKIFNIRTFKLRLITVKQFTNELWNNCMHMLPKNSLNITIAITIILLVLSKAKKQIYFYYIFLLIVAFSSTLLPLFLLDVGICGRISVPITMNFGVSSLVLIANALYNKKNYQLNIAIIFTFFIFLINGFFIIQNTSEHIAANRIDQNLGQAIKELIEKYEQENNVIVTKLGYTYDVIPQQFSNGIKPIQSMTERSLACSWRVLYVLNYYCDKKFKLVPFKLINKKNYFFNYTNFFEEQISFEGDTIFIILY